MTVDTFNEIAKKINYLGRNESAYNLYERLGQCDCQDTDRVEFALRHWGWTGKEQRGADDIIKKMKSKLFVFPPIAEMFIKQFYKILIPVRAGKVGAHIDFDPYFWCENCYNSEIMSIQYNVRMVCVGIIQYFYNDFEFRAERLDFAQTNKASSFWEFEIFLSNNGKIYYHERDMGVAGILSESMLSFFTEMFEFPNATKKGFKSLTKDDSLIHTTLLEEIEQQVEAGTYRPRKI